MRINTQLTLIVCIVVTILMAFYIIFDLHLQTNEALTNLHDNTAILASELNATTYFISKNVSKLNTDSNGKVDYKGFIPSYVLRGVSQIFNINQGYSFKWTTFKVRSPVNTPDPFEVNVMKEFAQNPNLKEFTGIETVNRQKVYRYMQPLYYEQQCLQCHGEPAGAIDISGFPKEGGHLGSFAGAISISVPLDQMYQNLHNRFFEDILSVFLFLLTLSLTIYIFIHKQIAKPLTVMVSLASQIGDGKLDISNTNIAENYEIRVLNENFNAMAAKLHNLYNNLEATVDERTRELQNVNEILNAHQESLCQINAKLTKASEVKSEFIATMSHELQTPLTSIIAYTEIIMEKYNGDKQTTEYIYEVYESAHHLLDLITDILDFSKIEKNKIQLHPTMFVFSEMTEVLAKVFHPLIQKNHQYLTIEVPPDLPVIVADKNKIKQALMNLLSNAIKFTPPEGHIHLRATYLPELESIQVSLSDTGRGIETTDLERIFDKFTQVDSGTTREFSGLGLGLAVAKHLIELHGGSIWAESVVEYGSTFYFTLPILAPRTIK